MIEIAGKTYQVTDAHVHVWDSFDGVRFGNTPTEPLGFGMVRQGGEEFRMLPPEYRDHQVPVEILLGYMDDTGIDKAVILQNPCYGDQRDYVKGVMDKYAGRFAGIGMIDPRDKAGVTGQMDILMKDYGFKGFKIEVPDVPFVMDDVEYDFLWKKIVEMDGVLCIDLGWGDGPFDYNIDRFENVMKKFPTMKCLVCHLGISRLWDPGQTYPYPHLMRTLKLLDINRDNLYFDFSALVDTDPTLEYPFPRVMEYVKLFKANYGTQRLIWASDMPMVLRYCTYQQTLTFFTKYAGEFFDEKDLRGILYDNAEKLFFA